MLTNTEGTLFNTRGESRGTSFGGGPGIKFQTCRGGEERGGEEERRREGRKERWEKRKKGVVQVIEVVGDSHAHKKRYLYFLEVSCFERVPRLTHIHILFRKTLHKYTAHQKYIYQVLLSFTEFY